MCNFLLDDEVLFFFLVLLHVEVVEVLVLGEEDFFLVILRLLDFRLFVCRLILLLASLRLNLISSRGPGTRQSSHAPPMYERPRPLSA